MVAQLDALLVGGELTTAEQYVAVQRMDTDRAACADLLQQRIDGQRTEAAQLATEGTRRAGRGEEAAAATDFAALALDAGNVNARGGLDRILAPPTDATDPFGRAAERWSQPVT